MKQITGTTKLTGLLGSPVKHSLSPLMHNTSFQHLGLDYVYLAFDVSTEQFETAVSGLRSIQISGFNLTMPHKQHMCELCDELSPASKIMHSVNTVVNDHGKFIGHSTDGIGYIRALEDIGTTIQNKKMTLLGAGGASLSILVQAALDGAREINIFSRKGERYLQAEKLIDVLRTYSDCKICIYDFTNVDILREQVLSSDILTNATSVGMAPNIDQTLIEDVSIFHDRLTVSDIIYNPSETKLLKSAKSLGLKTQNGLPMLLYQGAAAFQLWTGYEMPVDIVKKHLPF